MIESRIFPDSVSSRAILPREGGKFEDKGKKDCCKAAKRIKKHRRDVQTWIS